jgi:hypothetical protein
MWPGWQNWLFSNVSENMETFANRTGGAGAGRQACQGSAVTLLRMFHISKSLGQIFSVGQD